MKTADIKFDIKFCTLCEIKMFMYKRYRGISVSRFVLVPGQYNKLLENWCKNICRVLKETRYGSEHALLFEPTCMYCTVGFFVSLSVCL